MWACVTISNRMWSLNLSWKVAIFLWNKPYRWRKTLPVVWGYVCDVCVSIRKEYFLTSAIMASVGLCVLCVCCVCVSLQANGGRDRASLKGTQIDCLLAVCAPFWWSPKIKTSFFISGCEKAAKQSTMDFLPLHKCFSATLSAASSSLHCAELKIVWVLTFVLQIIFFVYLIIGSSSKCSEFWLALL